MPKKYNPGTNGFNLICLFMIILQYKYIVNPKFQEMLYFAYGWHITSQSKGLSNLLSCRQRSDLLKRAGLLRLLTSRLFEHSPRQKNFKVLLRKCLVQKVKKGLTLHGLFCLSSQFLVTNPVQGDSVFVLKFGLLLRIPEMSFPFEDVDFRVFDPSFHNFLKELVLVSEIVRLFRDGNFMLKMLLDGRNLEINFFWQKYIRYDYPDQDFNSFGDIFSRLTKLFKFDEFLKRYAPSIVNALQRKKGRRYPLHEAALVMFCVDLLRNKFVSFHNFFKMIDDSQLAPEMLYSAYSQLRRDCFTLIQIPLSASIVPSHSKLAQILDVFSEIIIPQQYINFLQERSNECLSSLHTASKYSHEYASKYVRFLLILAKLIGMIQSRNAHFLQLLLLWQEAQIATESELFFRSAMVDLLDVLKQQKCCESEHFLEYQSNLAMMISFTNFGTCIYDMLNFIFQYLSKEEMLKFMKKHMESQTDSSSFFRSLNSLISQFFLPRHSFIGLRDFEKHLLTYVARCQRCDDDKKSSGYTSCD